MYQLKKEPSDGVVIICSFYFFLLFKLLLKHKILNLPPELLFTLQSSSAKHILSVI